MSPAEFKPVRRRIDSLDIARTLALIAMAVYHFTWDLEFFGYVARGLTGHGGWKLFARGIASSFLFLVGVSLVLAHARGIRWRPFAKRLAQVVAGAAAITVVTYFTTPNAFVFFGILHQIAFASLVGLLFLRLPFPITALLGAAIIATPFLVSTPLTNSRWLAWIGLPERQPLSNDLVPVLPWFGVVLLGIAFARLAQRVGWIEKLRALGPAPRWLQPAALLGRHTLLFYLLHQPILFGLVWAFAQVAPPDPIQRFQADCRQSCLVERDAAFCDRYCACAQADLASRKLLDRLMNGSLGEADRDAVREVVEECSFGAR
ncbi:heparan-alpha-glucosaminide N-acetyltransferase [Mangrovicella endophytica]|uniref:heparan-alpha-glucosaminide N-acetyltransferase n=1 Tax=Mangrovicella endophytica TaxID=2066697 RepID=UPI001FE242BC|nr:heparan-alpha-glucosaminide N-acetyltransferase [Mangrovicella endophytica]